MNLHSICEMQLNYFQINDWHTLLVLLLEYPHPSLPAAPGAAAARLITENERRVVVMMMMIHLFY